MEEKKPNKDPNYFTAILQLRNLNEEVIAYLKKAVREDKEGTFISKEIEEKDGSDFYLSQNKFARRIAKQLINHFGGTLSENERLFSFNKSTSKNIYRLNIFVEFPRFMRNDIIKIDDRVYLVRVVGKNVSLVDLATGKPKVIEYKSIKRFEKLKKFETRVIKVHPALTVLDENHEPALVMNKLKKELKTGEKVKVVFCDGCYII